jgi:hypothetical protein
MSSTSTTSATRASTPFDYSVKDGLRSAGSRGGGNGPRRGRILEIRFDLDPEVERRVLRLVRELLDELSTTVAEPGASGREP